MKLGFVTAIWICRVSGGATNLPMWNQMMADVFDCVVETVAASDATALVAAMIASVGVGKYKDLQEAADNMVQITSRYEPIPENVVIYKEFYQKYMLAYSSLNQNDFYQNGVCLQEQYGSDAEV